MCNNKEEMNLKGSGGTQKELEGKKGGVDII